MCGIWALFGNDGDADGSELSERQWRSCHTIAHRGPDAWRVEGLRHVRGCCLGFHRLSIVDDMLGMQPMRVFSKPHIWLLYNGEIYNHKLLDQTHGLRVSTACDGEPIIHLYSSQGPQAMASQLDGEFAMCIVDTTSRTVVLARDTFGVRPLFTCHSSVSGCLLGICSEAKGLMDLAKSVTGARIEAFPPGHVVVYDLDPQGKAVLRSRSRFHSIGQPPVYKTLASPNGDVKKNIRTLLEAAVRKRLMGERTIGCLLSGGLDSSLVAGLTVSLCKEMGVTDPVHTFSVGMASSPDILAAQKVAEYLKTEHHEVIFTPEEALDAIPDVIYHLESYDITTVRASVAMYLISRYIRQKTDVAVILSGEGADEVAQGYIYFHKAPSASEGDAESRRILQDLYYFDVLRADRTTAAWGLEVRVPFLDHQFTSYYLSLPAEARQPRDGVEKALLREAFGDSQLIPADILWRPKEAFSDGLASTKKSWFQMVQEYCEQKISDVDLEAAKLRYPHNTPETKEALYYRQLFEDRFSGPDHASWIPYFWLPRWADTKDPSARTLDYYRQ